MALIKTNARSATALDATILTGNLPAINGSALTNLVAGKIGQVVSASKQTVASFSSSSTNTFVDLSGLTLNITPSATSSKIYCVINANKCLANASDLSAISFQIVRDSTAIYTSINYLYQTNDDTVNGSTTFSVVDEPDTTSATTYKLQIRNRESNNVVLNNGGDTDSSITLMEILA